MKFKPTWKLWVGLAAFILAMAINAKMYSSSSIETFVSSTFQEMLRLQEEAVAKARAQQSAPSPAPPTPGNIQDILKQIQAAQGQIQSASSYDQFVGWLYANPRTAGTALNDLKARAFEPTCKFRYTWATDLPAGLNRPIPPQSKDLANVAYKSWLDCLSTRGWIPTANMICKNQLNDAMKRFMEPGCSLQMNKEPGTYNVNYSPVF